jgi:hypothetical protein
VLLHYGAKKLPFFVPNTTHEVLPLHPYESDHHLGFDFRHRIQHNPFDARAGLEEYREKFSGRSFPGSPTGPPRPEPDKHPGFLLEAEDR